MVERHQDRDWLADHLLGCVAEDTVSAFVPTHYDAVEILANDRVIG